jgi:hypothetical protein
LAALVADDVGDDAVTALVAALHASAPLDAAPRPALAILRDIADGDARCAHEQRANAACPPMDDAARAARAFIARFTAACDAPFPDVADWLARVPGSSSSTGGSG